ncbi:HAD-IB family hydrolase [Citrobacter amalonaticus]|uniref:HAD-IB family hydrolase n=1 Tax=Citrobacter amalonaticus TaxID=35703 RepID=A0A2S4S3Q5_CITAM|nr:HAD family hydrolase [Citrobacter amalonaticus]POT59900.1 HAD-IB family hydrolase [Citrobacter amalonaticus]POT78031.1 HAD-IB family hydrolase [Citrobacter amalonaticus]POU68483.1 HAD-IB family hydrolase [Citrobacter amalonaticus]POV08086.1 HAD-IB family hydrolase [Citrobacter amalonaticus]
MLRHLYIFDLDHTLIAGDSSTWWSRYLVREGLVKDARYLVQEASLMRDYAEGKMDIHQYVALTLAPLAKMTIAEADQRIAQWVRDEVMPRVYPQALKLIQQLQAEKQQMLIISASASLLVKPIARALGIEEAAGIDVHIVNNRYTNIIDGTPSYREGKIARLKAWMALRNEPESKLTFYTDSINDLPLCLFADEVVLVNPCSQLQEQGKIHHWPTLYWRSE